jgi:hypothetical protein|tara:strand:- start:1169 stop:2077 length:909 start_codon:yes stop_codon:yes gene_type:complete
MSTPYFKPINYYIENKFSCNKQFQDTYSNVKRIVVIGDIHGDFNILLTCLKKANVINSNKEWIGGSTHIVQLGDILDKGGRGIDSSANSMEEFSIYEFLNYLDTEAEKYGGKVHYLIGNHEIMNMEGDFRYVHKKHLDATGDSLRRKLFKPGGYMARLLACHSYGILKINKWYFCHAGLLPEHVNTNTITQINTIVRDVLRGNKKTGLTKHEKDLLFSQDSIFWNRKYYFDKNKCDMLEKTLDILNEKDGGLIVGHTVHKNITSECNKKLWFADVGLSPAFGDSFSNIELLEIINDNPRVIK